jgi:hypothetical protein
MISVKKYASREDAELARHKLEDSGITAHLGGEIGSGLMGSLTTGGYSVEVNLADKARALEVLASMGQDDDISDAELEALAMSEPGQEQEVEPSADEPAELPDPGATQRAWRGLCWGSAAGLAFTIVHCYYHPAEIENLLPKLVLRIPLFGLLGVFIALKLRKSKN